MDPIDLLFSTMLSQHPLPELWTHVVRNNKKGKQRQQQQNVSFSPVLITPPVSSAGSSQNASAATSTPKPIAMVRPFMNGIEEDSVFIDVTALKDRALLDKALVKFNEEAEQSELYEDFLGYRKQTRHYLGHQFLETLWLPNAEGRKTLIEQGITLEDGTFLKGFPSFSEDAQIVRITMEKLPFLPAVQLKREMAERFSCFGEVLDHGIFKTENGIFQGEGYVTLNLTLSNAPENECMDSHEDGSQCQGKRHLEPLKRVIIWDTLSREEDQRQILLQWDQMPAFCRQCQKPDHCRADCPDYHKWAICYHCNKRGHVSKNCNRNNSESVPSKVRAVERTSAKTKERKGAKTSAQPSKPSETQRLAQEAAAQDHHMAEALPSRPASPTVAAQHHQETRVEDAHMNETTESRRMSDADALTSVSRDVPRSAPVDFDPTKAAKKLTRKDGASDIGDARYQSSDSSNTHREVATHPTSEFDNFERNTTPPGYEGTPPANNQ
ncbi:CCHC-type zinc finger transcription factor [Mucor lusitanicus]|uniref:CCHC-type zinc finger transcription factor n=3 Tax=Mucor circinelloides f. lusitanicus TaxID=29924 RepID=A0A162U2I9_MUCCL|nr:CCHC-type zinc finger transcription factor [Mucor lusitanicus CBS 277.49]